MLVLAHRGYHAELPENTLVAFEAAVALGADGIETDVQVTRDGVPVLFHDTTIRGQPVAGFTHAELCRLSQHEVAHARQRARRVARTFSGTWKSRCRRIRSRSGPSCGKYREKRRLLVSSFWHPVAVQAGRELGVDCGLAGRASSRCRSRPCSSVCRTICRRAECRWCGEVQRGG